MFIGSINADLRSILAGLAREAGMSWNRLWSELTKLGYTKGA
jgi:hypothetical protein